MSNPIIQKLRQAIDAKHAEALESLDKLAAYLENVSVSQPNGKSPTKKPPPRQGTGKIRNPVLAAFRQGFLSVQAVAEQTKLTPLQVRGVVLAPALKARFLKKKVDGVMHYKWEGESTE